MMALYKKDCHSRLILCTIVLTGLLIYSIDIAESILADATCTGDIKHVGNVSTQSYKVTGALSGAFVVAFTVPEEDGRYIFNCWFHIAYSAWDASNIKIWFLTVVWRAVYENGTAVNLSPVYHPRRENRRSNFSWFETDNENWGHLCGGTRHVDGDLGMLDFHTTLWLNRVIKNNAWKNVSYIECLGRITPIFGQRYSLLMARLNITVSEDGTVLEVGHPMLFHRDVGTDNVSINKGIMSVGSGDGVSNSMRFFVGTAMGAGVMAILAGGVFIFAMGLRILIEWWRRRISYRNRHRIFPEGERFDLGMGILARGFGHAGYNGAHRHDIPGAIAGIVPAVMAAGVAAAAFALLPGTYARTPGTYWTGGIGADVGDLGKSHYAGKAVDASECSNADRLQASMDDAREALRGNGKLESHLEFKCPKLGDRCEAICRFTGMGQYLDTVLSWASERGHEGDDVRREWLDHECDLRRSCKIDRSSSKENGGSPIAKVVCGYSGICTWDFGPRGNDLSGLYRCAVYYAPEFFELPDGGTASGRVSVDPGTVTELMLQTSVAESMVVGCIRPGDDVSVESVIAFPIIYYRQGIFNWTYDGPEGGDGVPAKIAAGAAIFNRTHIEIEHGVEGSERSFMKPPIDTVDGRAEGMLRFVFVARKPGIYRGLLVLDTLRRFSCVLAVPEDPCAEAKVRSFGFPSAAGSIFTTSSGTAKVHTESKESVESDQIPAVDVNELYSRAVAVIVLSLAFIAMIMTAAVCIWGKPTTATIIEEAYSDAADGEEETITELIADDESMI